MNRETALRWSGYLAMAIVFAVACAFLSNWQFSRNAERDAELRLVAQNYSREPVPVGELIPDGSSLAADDEWRPVEMTGQYLTDQTLLARNRPHGGTSAFEVLVPFRTDSGRVVVVDRGWVPPGDDQPEPDSIPAPPTGEVTVVGRLQPGERPAREGRSAPEGQVPTIDLQLIGTETGQSSALLDSAYVLMTTESPAPADRPNPLEDPSADPGPYLSYAIQWILFAVMGFAFIGYIIRTEIRHRREDEEAGPDAPPRRPTQRRRDRDMEAEDELLDAR
ncbi:SURF1 family cytochrome oxidase biogenesis protein [Microbacterium aquilitoris]|uniref:SURF1 family cytochrome oxidase biogenesis protein n=1 Tax=Microbacterium aquilitoris TaxID=3067307 RepID=UPI000E233B7F|nr:SURF1 family protein [Microbacterium sp. KSW2-22]MDT3343677.1 SURF1 family protein [Microbacterium sp. KSW2-22]